MSMLLSFAVLTASTMGQFQVNLGRDTTCAVYNEKATCWGDNSQGQLGLGDNVDRLDPEESALNLGTDRSGNEFVADSAGCGHHHCCALSTDQELKCWGHNKYSGLIYDANFESDFDGCNCLTDFIGNEDGEMDLLMPMTSVSGAVEMAVFFYSSCVLEDHDGALDLRCVGFDNEGKGMPIGVTSLDAMVASWSEVKLGGGVWTVCWFDPNLENTLTCDGGVDVESGVTDGSALQSVKCGKEHCCALTDTGSLLCWGEDSEGQTNTATLDAISDFGDVLDFAVSYESTCALSTTGKVACFGQCVSGLCGTTESYFDISTKFTQSGVRFAGGVGMYHYCLFEETDVLELQCWGYNDHGQLGYGTVDAEDAEDLDSVVLPWDVEDSAPSPPSVPVPAPAPTPCPVSLSGFQHCDVNGEWEVDVDLTVGDDVVYSKEGVYGSTAHLWQATVDGNPLWVVGRLGTDADSYWGYRWGNNLFDPCDTDADECASWYYSAGGQWSTHSIEPVVSCSDGSDVTVPEPDAVALPVPAPSDQCFPTLSGYIWSEYNTQWTPVHTEDTGGRAVYSIQTSYSGTGIRYLWLNTDTSSGNPAWVIGDDYTVQLYRGWKWGEDLYDGANWYYHNNGLNWHSTNPDMSCSAPEASAAVSISGAFGDAETEEEIQSEPPFTEESTTSGSAPMVWMETLFGAVMAIMVIAAVLLLAVLVKRRRSSGKKEEMEMCDAVHVVEVSPSEVAEATTTADAGNTESV